MGPDFSPTTVFRRSRVGVPEATMQRLHQHCGIAPATLRDGHGDLIVGKVHARLDNWRWEPAADGEGMLIVPCGWFWRPAGWVEIDDVVAFSPDRPDDWRLLTGGAVLLERDAVVEALRTGGPLVIHSTPLDWLRAGCTGTCIVDWSLNPYAELHLDRMAPGQIQCADAETMLDLWGRCRQIDRAVPQIVTTAPKAAAIGVAA
ncbi:MAG: hypothetical protein H6842_04680 [Rhodospirillaceae bacterium]|nr:hypothetical protein [Rhodospirillaceae bacterium]